MNTVEVQGDLWDEDYRRMVARQLAEQQGSGGINVPEDEGYVLLPKGTVQGFDDFRARVRQLFKERLQADGSIAQMAVNGGKKKPKGYMQSVLCRDDFARHPELLALGLNPRVLAAVSRYLGTLPVLRTVDVFWTPPSNGAAQPEGSQFFHFDHDDYRELKMFFYIEDMDEQGGPFTFLPKPVADIVKKQAKAFKGKRYADEEVYGVCSTEDAIKFTGPAGTGAIVDTSNCLHFGGRVDHRGRLLVQHLFLRPKSNIIEHGRINMGEIAGLELDELGRMVVAVPPWIVAKESTEPY